MFYIFLVVFTIITLTSLSMYYSRLTRVTENLKQDQSCTPVGGDPYYQGHKNSVHLPCCSGLTETLGNYGGNKQSYQCIQTTPKPPPPSTNCTAVGDDVYKTGKQLNCCNGNQPVLDQWNPGKQKNYICLGPNNCIPENTVIPNGNKSPCCDGLTAQKDSNGIMRCLSSIPSPTPTPSINPSPTPSQSCIKANQQFPKGSSLQCCQGLVADTTSRPGYITCSSQRRKTQGKAVVIIRHGHKPGDNVHNSPNPPPWSTSNNDACKQYFNYNNYSNNIYTKTNFCNYQLNGQMQITLPNNTTPIEYGGVGLSSLGVYQSIAIATIVPQILNKMGLQPISRVVTQDPTKGSTGEPFQTIAPFILQNNIDAKEVIFQNNPSNIDITNTSGSIFICGDEQFLWQDANGNSGDYPAQGTMLGICQQKYNNPSSPSNIKDNKPQRGQTVYIYYGNNKLQIYYINAKNENDPTTYYYDTTIKLIS